MKVESFGKKFQGGVITLEIMIAFAVLILSISAVILVVFGNQSIIVDTENNSDALQKTIFGLERARAQSSVDFDSIVPNSEIEIYGAIEYTKNLFVKDITQCKKQVTSAVGWIIENQKPQKIELTTFLTNIPEALALGGDCESDNTNSNWSNLQVFAQNTTGGGEINAVDALNGIAYLGTNNSPHLEIVDTKNLTPNQTGNLFINFSNNFSTPWPINDLDVVEWRDPSSGTIKNYVFAVIATSTNQLNVIDVTNILNPIKVAEETLNNVDPNGSFPEGHRVFYYKDRLYITTRETMGAELHIFNVSNPVNPIEIGQGISLDITVNDMVIKEQKISGVVKKFAYLATSQDSGELRIYDITDLNNDGTIIEITQAKQDLPGNQNGQSIYIIGNKLYLGRQSTSNASDLYVFDISNPESGLLQVGDIDVGTGVTQIRTVGDKFAFLSTAKVGQEIQIWDISDLTKMFRIGNYNFPQMSWLGIDYENNFLYAVGRSVSNFQIIHSPNI